MRLVVVVVLVLFVQLVSCQFFHPRQALRKFARVRSLNDFEKFFVRVPNAGRAYEYLAYYTSLPHIAGSPEDYETAVFTKTTWESFGIPAKIEKFDALLSYPLERSVEIVAPPNLKFKASLKEAIIPEDPTSSDPRVPSTFNGYSPSGNVTAPLVYVNYATIEDYTLLKELEVNLTGKIHIARYGSIFRGTKAMLAQSFGAVGLLIYSDPADDGFKRGPVYPEGPWKPETGVQRGSVQFLSVCAGDPRKKNCLNASASPSEMAEKIDQLPTIPSIPVQPLSWRDAYPLLKGLQGLVAPQPFQGGLNLTYRVGPGPVVVNIFLLMNFTIGPLWNVIGQINGTLEDRYVMLGNHRDAWTFGAADPNSGTAVLLEVARGLGELLKKGWKPHRTILLCSWDGEEYGLLGSTYHAETHEEKYSAGLIAYMNVDVGVTGTIFRASATPSLKSFLIETTKDVIDPSSGKSLYEVWDKTVDILGSGSDYTAFLDHIGIPSLDMRFNGPYGVYHSTYDSQHWMNTFGSPTYVYYVALAQLWGLLTLRLVNATVLPLDFVQYAASLKAFSFQAQQLLNSSGGNSSVRLSELEKAVLLFEKAANSTLNATKDDNDRLMLTERQFLGPGLPARPWFRHVVQAPGIFLGYGAESFPGLTESIQARNWTVAQSQADIIATRITAAATFLSPSLRTA